MGPGKFPMIWDLRMGEPLFEEKCKLRVFYGIEGEVADNKEAA